jgi:hypothetical protein
VVDHDAPSADRNDDYLAKYGARIRRISRTHARFAQRYSVPVRIRITRVRGH